jgi:DNA-binding NarL/FixJ family response regulator
MTVDPKNNETPEAANLNGHNGRGTPIRIVVADDVTLDRCALSHLVASWPECRVVAETSSAAETADACQKMAPDLVLMSLALPSRAANPVLELRSVVPGQKVMAIAERPRRACASLLAIERVRASGHMDATTQATMGDCLDLAAECGADGTIRRDAGPEQLREAILRVAHGDGFHEFDTSRTVKQVRRALSPRETEVASLLAEGRSNKEIADRLDVSEPTVKKHIGHVLRKLALQDRLQVALFVSRHPEYITNQAMSLD